MVGGPTDAPRELQSRFGAGIVAYLKAPGEIDGVKSRLGLRVGLPQVAGRRLDRLRMIFELLGGKDKLFRYSGALGDRGPAPALGLLA